MPHTTAYTVLSANVTPQMAAALRAVAEREGVKLSVILRDALAEYLLRRAGGDVEEG